MNTVQDLLAADRSHVWHPYGRPFRDLVYTMAPYVTGDDDLAQIIRGVLAAVHANLT